MATTAQVDAIVALYAGYFNRAPDPAGLQFWIDQIDGGREFNTIAADFAASPEATALYPYLTTPDVASPSTFITNVYQNLFNRAPDAEGLQFWTDVLNEGSVSVADMIEAIINGAVDAPDATPPTFDASTLENKIEVGRDFAADAANTTGFVFDDAAKSAAIDVIDGVTNDDATVDAAKAETDAFLDGAANPGDTFTLTTGADVVAGTAGNDTINALPVNATGGNASTFSAFDDIDGGAGTDTLNIFTNGSFNGGFPTSASVENVEIVNINNATAGGFGTVDAADFDGAAQIWQVANANSIQGLAASTTAGFRKTASGTFGVTAAAGAATAAIALEDASENSYFQISGADLTTVTISGNAIDDADLNTTVDDILVDVQLAEDAQTGTVNSEVAADLFVNNAGGDAVTSIDASGSTGDITLTFAVSSDIANVETGTGDDTVLIQTATSNVAGSTVAAMVQTGEGDDTVNINTTGTGTTTVNSGAGDDTVTLFADGSGKLSVNLGEGDDAFLVNGGTVSKGDTIDGGAGTDTVQLKDIGSANIGAFTNFEIFDAVGLGTTLDTDILASNNTVTEFVASGDVNAGAALTNVAAGAGVRVTGDMDVNALSITQKTAGSLTVTHDIDEAAAATTAPGDVSGNVTATNATSVEAVFDSSFVDAATGTGDNVAELNLTAEKATSLSVNSGGDVAMNDLTVNDADALTSVTVTGDQMLDLDFITGTSKLASVDASASTGGLIFDMADLAEGGSLTLGSGSDTVVTSDNQGSTAATIETVVGFEKAASNAAADVSVADIINSADTLTIVADDTDGAGTLDISNGVVEFLGTGPTTLAEAISFVDAALATDDEAAVFDYLGDSYVFINDDTNGDTVIQLADLTGVSELGVSSGNLFIV